MEEFVIAYRSRTCDLKIPLLKRNIIGCLGAIEMVDYVVDITEGESLSWARPTTIITSMSLGEDKIDGKGYYFINREREKLLN